MIAVSTPNHPLRLAGVLAASIAFFVVVSGAIYAAMWMVDDYRNGGAVNEVAGESVPPKVDLPAGLIQLQPIVDVEQFERFAGFKPFIPKSLPDTTQTEAKLALTFPDANGVRTGRVGFSPKEGAEVDGISGPIVVLMEAKGAAGPNVDGQLRRLTSGSGRAIVATVACHDLVLDIQLYFQPNPQPGEPYVTPYMTDVAQRFVDGVNAQCGN